MGNVPNSHIDWIREGVTEVPCLLLCGDELYVVDADGPTCLDAKTGKVHWMKELPGWFYASPLCADGKIYFQSKEGICYVVKSGAKFELLAKNSINEKSCASYAAADGAIFMRTFEHLYRIEKRER